MFKFWKFICVYALLTISLVANAQQASVESLRYWTAPDRTRMVFDISSVVDHDIFLLDNPSRLVIDFDDSKLSKPLTFPPKGNPLIKKIRSAVKENNGLRVVVDLKATINPKSFTLKPNRLSGHRLVIDLFDEKKLAKASKKTSKVSSSSRKTNKVVTKSAKNRARDIVIAIDAGHGGEDPGATGAKGTQEKKVVLQIAKKLAVLINKKPGMKAVMVRKGDYYIGLRKRMEIARKEKADLFISIHADAFKNSKVKGATVFTLSNRGASSEAARWLAKHENSSDLVGGVKLADKEDMVANVLMDLSQKATKDASRDVAKKVLHNLKSVGHLHKHHVQKAGFVVLKSPDIPSILIETAFISNPREERKLRTRAHQIKMAKAIFKGVVSYYNKHAPADSLFALASKAKANRHVISRGDTLSKIAQKYGVSMRTIKSANALPNYQIQVGQVLKIPKG